MTALILKIIALVSMLIDHAGILLATAYPELSHILIWFRAIGRLAWPIFAFLLAEGFRHTLLTDKSTSEYAAGSRSLKFLMRLLAFALISEIPYDLAMGNNISFAADTNIFYTLFLGGMTVCLFERLKEKYSSLNMGHTTAFMGAILPTVVLAEILRADYGGVGVLLIFTMYAISNKPKPLRLAALGIFALSQFIPLALAYSLGIAIRMEYLMMIPFALAPVPLIAFYNGKRGFDVSKNSKWIKIYIKWLFYWAYPAHLAMLAAIALFVL